MARRKRKPVEITGADGAILIVPDATLQRRPPHCDGMTIAGLLHEAIEELHTLGAPISPRVLASSIAAWLASDIKAADLMYVGTILALPD